jgi:hypothetical protein
MHASIMELKKRWCGERFEVSNEVILLLLLLLYGQRERARGVVVTWLQLQRIGIRKMNGLKH